MKENMSAGHLSRLAISRLLAGGNPDAGNQASPLPGPMAAHLAGCRECQAAVSQARIQSEEILRKFPTFESLDGNYGRRRAGEVARTAADANSLARRILQTLDRVFGRFNSPVIGAAFATLLVLGLGTWVWKAGNPDIEKDYAAKGEGTGIDNNPFFIFRNGIQAYGDTLPAGPRDTLQLGIVSPRPVYYAVLFRDDGKPLGAYLGGSETNAAPLGNPQGEPLPKSLILDGEWKQEILYCVWADRPFSIEEARLLIEGPVSQAGDLHLHSVFLRNPSH